MIPEDPQIEIKIKCTDGSTTIHKVKITETIQSFKQILSEVFYYLI